MSKKLLLIIGSVAGVIAITLGIIMITNNKKTYIISFDTDGGSLVEKQEVKDGENIIKPSNPTKENYLFEEWTYNGRTFNFNTIVESDMTLIAKWKKEKPDEFSIVIDSKNGTESKTITVLEDEKLEKPEDPTYKGYTFVEWQVNGVPYDFNQSVTRPFILEAKWEKIKAKYTVTFNSNGGTAVAKQTVEEGQKAEEPTTSPTKEDATFVEWQLNGKAYDFEQEVTGNITLKAKWNEIKYTAYNRDTYYLKCYIAGTTTIATNVDKGTKIECDIDFETNASDPVSTFKYDLKYGKGLKLVKSDNVKNAKISNGNYKFTLSKATSVGSGGDFTFEVTDISNSSELYVGIENIKFTTSNNKHFTSGNAKQTMKTTWDEMKEKAVAYKEDVFHFSCGDVTTLKKGDKITCGVSYELYAEDSILKFQYDIKYGKGFKLVKSENLENAITSGTNYKHTFNKAYGVGSGGRFTFEVTDASNTSELYVSMENVSFLTQKSEYYTSSKITKRFGDVWTNMDKYATQYKESIAGIGCDTGDSLIIPKEVGQKFRCLPSFELYTYDAMTHFKFDIKTGKGIKYLGVTKDDVNNEIKTSEIVGNTHRITFNSSESIFQYAYVLNFEIIDISNPDELYVSIDNIKFKTIKDEYYFSKPWRDGKEKF